MDANQMNAIRNFIAQLDAVSREMNQSLAIFRQMNEALHSEMRQVRPNQPLQLRVPQESPNHNRVINLVSPIASPRLPPAPVVARPNGQQPRRRRAGRQVAIVRQAGPQVPPPPAPVVINRQPVPQVPPPAARPVVVNRQPNQQVPPPAARPVVVVPQGRPNARVVTRLLSHEEYHSNMEEPCAICMETYNKGISAVTECNHSFCHGCVYRLLQLSNRGFSCPMCRANCTIVQNFGPKKGCRIRVSKEHKEIRKNLSKIN